MLFGAVAAPRRPRTSKMLPFGLLLACLLTQCTTTQARLSCPPGAHRFGSVCFKLSDRVQFSFREALLYCTEQGMQLASIHRQEETDFVTNVVMGARNSGRFIGAWLALRYDAAAGVHEWADGTPLDYVNWEESQPLDEDRESCVSMNSASGRWRTQECSQISRFFIPYQTLCRSGAVWRSVAGRDEGPAGRAPLGAQVRRKDGWRNGCPHCHRWDKMGLVMVCRSLVIDQGQDFRNNVEGLTLK